MKKQIKIVIGIIVIIIGLIISLEILNHFYNQGDIDGKFRVLYSELWALNDYVAFVIYSLLFSVGGVLFIVGSTKAENVFEIVLFGLIIEFIFLLDSVNYNYYWGLPMIIAYFLLLYKRLEYENKLFVRYSFVVVCLVTIIYVFSHCIMPEHFYNILEFQAASCCR